MAPDHFHLVLQSTTCHPIRQLRLQFHMSQLSFPFHDVDFLKVHVLQLPPATLFTPISADFFQLPATLHKPLIFFDFISDLSLHGSSQYPLLLKNASRQLCQCLTAVCCVDRRFFGTHAGKSHCTKSKLGRTLDACSSVRTSPILTPCCLRVDIHPKFLLLFHQQTSHPKLLTFP